MFTKIKEFLFGKPAEVAAPYKVEAPALVAEPKPEPAKCGCGRSTTGLCVGLHKLSDDEWAKHPDNKTVATATPKKAPAKKQQFEKKAAAPKAETKPKVAPKAKAAGKAKAPANSQAK